MIKVTPNPHSTFTLNPLPPIHRDKDVFYYEMEYRRLEWKKSRVEAALKLGSGGPFRGRSKELERAQQALDVSVEV